MLIAVEGCAHGELDKIYETVQFLERQQNVKVDLLLCCGDFQAVRNESDLLCMAVPPKYRSMCSFYKYYSGEKQAPILTIFIGGNHEASNHLQELAYGGWVAPNIYYLGYAGVVNIGGIRIAGISGIFKGHDHLRGRFEKPPYSQETMRSAYHVRNLEVFRLKQTKDPIDVFLSHDWPRGIYHYGNTPELLHWKPYFRNEIESNMLGSPAAESLLHELKPEYWFSAHLHVRYQALVPHSQTQATKFLALDKCLPRRRHLELISVNHDPAKPFELHYDPEWLAILRSTNHLLSTSTTIQYMPGPGYNGRWCFKPTEEEIDAVVKLFNDDFKVPLNFSRTDDAYDPRNPKRNATPPAGRTNPQTTEFCRKLGIDDPMEILLRQSAPSSNLLSIDSLEPEAKNPDEIALDDCDDDEEEAQTKSETPVGVEDLFFVDTKPQRTKLSLPEPQTSTENHENATEDILIPKPEIPQLAEETSSTPAEEPQPKKFRRRNRDIYTAEIE